MKKILYLIMILTFSVSFISCADLNFKNKYAYEYVKDVECVVIDKNYKPSYTTIQTTSLPKPDGTISIENRTVVHPARYDIKVKYEELNLKNTFDNSSLYDKYEVGDKINLKLYKNAKDQYNLSY